MPGKGDKVRVTFDGVYSHQGNADHLKAGFHVVTTSRGGDKLGRDECEVAVPPSATIDVLEEYKLPEPNSGVVAYNAVTNTWWRNTGAPIWPWYQIGDPRDTFGVMRLNWIQLLRDSNRGHALTLYLPESKG